MMNNQEIRNDNHKKGMKISIVLSVLMIIVAATILFIPGQEKEVKKTQEFSSVERICELATVRSYYHNVAEYRNEPDGLFKYGLFQYGYKKCWIEYEGFVDLGIEFDEVEINEPNEEGVVYVYIPKAKVLDVGFDKASMSDPLVDTGVFTKLTTEEKAEAHDEAQKNMKENAKKDKYLMSQAQNNAKILIEKYIINVGKMTGKDYIVEWLDKPLNKTK